MASVFSGESSISLVEPRGAEESVLPAGNPERRVLQRVWKNVDSHQYRLECMDHAELQVPDTSDSTSRDG